MISLSKQYIEEHKLLWQLLWKLSEHFLRPKRLLKTQFFEKKAIFPVEKILWPIRSRSFDHDKCHETILWRSRRQFEKFCAKTIRSFLKARKKSRTKLFKKRISSGDKRFWPIFSRIIGCDKPQQKTCIASKSVLTTTAEVMRSFLYHLWNCWKHKFFKKKAMFSVKKLNEDFF